jgi:hypothetical protein
METITNGGSVRRGLKSEAMIRRNRRVGLIVAFVAVAMLVAAAIYIAYWGGTNKGPMQPFH